MPKIVKPSDGQVIYREPQKRVFDCIANVDAQLEGSIVDWPANIQDILLKKMEEIQDREKVTLTITESFCDYDIDSGWFARIICTAPARQH